MISSVRRGFGGLRHRGNLRMWRSGCVLRAPDGALPRSPRPGEPGRAAGACSRGGGRARPVFVSPDRRGRHRAAGDHPARRARDWQEETLQMRPRFGEGLIGWAAANGRPVLANEAHLDARAGQVLGTPDDEPEAVMCFPLISGGVVVGAFSLYREGEGQFFSDEEFEMAQRFADAMTLALANAKAREQLLYLARNDYLTGCLNRRGFHQELQALASFLCRDVARAAPDRPRRLQERQRPARARDGRPAPPPGRRPAACGRTGRSRRRTAGRRRVRDSLLSDVDDEHGRRRRFGEDAHSTHSRSSPQARRSR